MDSDVDRPRHVGHPSGLREAGYDWRDGVGPVDERPTKPNPAWGGLEYNLFGTAELIEFCEAVGCEPSLCVNAGDGTPEEAAKWVEYCNGDPENTEMGRLRAEHGYEEPFGVTYWEVGNELWGPWQVRWTTPAGNADRYERFREAMLEADPSIEVTACGVVTNDDRPWNETLLEECGEDVRAISSHPLAGGQVDAATDPDELYRAFMGYSEQLADQYAALEEQMRAAGVSDPKLDVTELQLFATLDSGGDADATDGASGGLTPETMPTSTTISEALYDATIRHALIRLGEFAELLTHSATVNHGGGLWKEGEHVWANPCHYGRSMATAQAGGTPVAVEVACDSIATGTTFREIDPVDVLAVDAMVTVDGNELTVVLVNRTSRSEPISTTPELEAFDAADEATVTALGGEAMHDENTRDEPERIVPESETVPVDGELTVELPPYSMARVDFTRDR
jgi:alpha-N-arabinofuranosidase